MTMFTRPHPRAEHARRDRGACRLGTARMGEGLGAGRALETGEGRATFPLALEVFRCSRRTTHSWRCSTPSPRRPG